MKNSESFRNGSSLTGLIQVFTAVTEGSISAQCGLQAGDRALSIDGKNVEKLDHQKFVEALKKTQKNIKLVVIGYQVDPVNPARDAEAADLGFKICVLKKEGKGYGFSLNTHPGSTEGTSEHVLQKVAAGGAADKAGVSDGNLLTLHLSKQVCIIRSFDVCLMSIGR